MIYCIGNSHANLFTNTRPEINGVLNIKPPFASYSLGPVIAYNFYEHHLPKVKEVLSEIDVKNDDYIMLIVGEVDARNWIGRYADKEKRTLEDVTEDCVNRFFACIDELNQTYKTLGWCGHPSTTELPRENPSEPIYGDCLTRNKTTRFWSDYLTLLCDKNGIPVINIIDELIGGDGLTKMEYFIDYCHLNYDKTINLILDKLKQQMIL